MLYHPLRQLRAGGCRFVRQAARDRTCSPQADALRVSGQSPIIAALSEAADAGKQVTVLLELKARFDEENNIHWGKRLERRGAHVIYGMTGLKTPSKITLVVRAEDRRQPKVRAPGDRQLQRRDRQHLHGPRLFTASEAIRQRRVRLFQHAHRILRAANAQQARLRAPGPQGKVSGIDRARGDIARAGKRAEILPRRTRWWTRHHLSAVRRVERGRAHPPHRARHLLHAAGLPGVSENIQVRPSSGGFWSTAGFSSSQTTASRRSTSPAPTGCPETSTAGWSSCSRWSSPSSPVSSGSY